MFLILNCPIFGEGYTVGIKLKMNGTKVRYRDWEISVDKEATEQTFGEFDCYIPWVLSKEYK